MYTFSQCAPCKKAKAIIDLYGLNVEIVNTDNLSKEKISELGVIFYPTLVVDSSNKYQGYPEVIVILESLLLKNEEVKKNDPLTFESSIEEIENWLIIAVILIIAIIIYFALS